MPEVLTAEPAQGIIKTPTSRRATGTPLISSARISRRVKRLRKWISSDYADIDTALVFACVIVLTLTSLFWRFGLKYYTGASS